MGGTPIIAVGAQNSFLIEQLRRTDNLICLLFILSDAFNKPGRGLWLAIAGIPNRCHQQVGWCCVLTVDCF